MRQVCISGTTTVDLTVNFFTIEPIFCYLKSDLLSLKHNYKRLLCHIPPLHNC